MQSGPLGRGAAYFQDQPFPDQLNVIWQRGALLETRRIPGFWLHLYALDTFFVEMWVCQRRYDVSLLRVLACTDELEPYLDRLSVDKLVL
jgi:hypothetical protein